MKCLETRQRNGMKWRRYRTEDGRTITTFEVPTAVLSRFSRKQLAEQLAAWRRGEQTRQRQSLVRARLTAGIKPTAIAHELGLTEQRVRQVRKEMKGTP
jgi:hypothetical protein